MPWRRRWRVRVVRATAVLGVIGWPTEASGQWLPVSRDGGEIGVEARRERSLGGHGAPSAVSLFTEWVAVRLQGTLGSPRLVAYAVNLRPTWAQQRANQTAAAMLNGLGASVSANILSASALPISVRGERSSGSVRGEFGSETHYRLLSTGATVRLQNRVFPIFLDYSTRRSLSDWESAFSAPTVRRDENWRTLRLSGQSTKLMANLERTQLIDGVGGLGYEATSARASHVIRWGRGSVLETSADGQWRHGHEPQRRRLLSASLRLRHAEAVASSLALQQQIVRAPTFSANTRGGSYALTVDRQGWLGASVDVAGSTSIYHNGRSSLLQATPTLRLNIALPFGAQVTGSAFAGALRRGQDFFGESWIVVSDERHSTPQTREFTLDFERADSTSITLDNEDRSLTYVNGFDYRLVRLGDLVRVSIPLSSRIRVGELLLVSYRYLLPPAPGIRTRSAGADASLAVGGLSLQHSIRRRRSSATDGAASDALDSADEYTTSATLRRALRFGRVQGDLTHRVRQHSRNDFTSTELRAAVASPAGYAVRGALGASGTQSRMNERDTRMVTTVASVGWMVSSTFQVQATAETWMWSTDNRARERLRSLNFEVVWSLGALETDWRYTSQQRHAAAVGTQHQFFGRVRRRF